MYQSHRLVRKIYQKVFFFFLKKIADIGEDVDKEEPYTLLVWGMLVQP